MAGIGDESATWCEASGELKLALGFSRWDALGFLIANHLNLGLLKSATVSPRPPNSSVVIVTFGAGKKLGSSPLPTKQAELKGILLGINIIIKQGGRLLQSEPGCGFPDAFQR